VKVFENKQVVVLGERDGVSGGAIQACVEAVGNATVAFAATECFV
jgi:glycine reductase